MICGIMIDCEHRSFDFFVVDLFTSAIFSNIDKFVSGVFLLHL